MWNISKRYLSRLVAMPLVVIILSATLCGPLAGCGAGNRTPVQGPIIDGKESYHVIVVSGEPEGVAAALAASRNGMKTLLVEKGDALGGLMTLGMLNIIDMNNSGRTMLTQGIFREFYKAVGDAFDIQEAKDWFLNTCLREPNLTVMLNTEFIAPVMNGNTITGVEIKRHDTMAPETVRSLAVIDATVDGDVAESSGAPYTWGGEDYGAHWVKQGVTLVFEVSGVDWDAVEKYLRNDGNPNSGADEKRAWGYGAESLKYISADGNMRFRGPNMARQKNGNLLLNALIIFGVDALDPDSLADGIDRGRREIPHIIEFMRENFIGFENAAYVSHAPRLYVRETRHFIGEYRLTITDVLENRDHWDRIGHGKYPVDIQPTGPDNLGTIIGVPDIYSIPFRCLVPLEIDGLLIASRSASYDSLPHGSARVIPIGMVAGEAAGTAAAYSVRNSVTFRQMTQDGSAIRWLQTRLKRQGAYLVEYIPPRKTVMAHWAYPGLVIMRELGHAAGGYANDYRLDENVPNRWALQNRANQMMRVISERTENRGEYQVPAWETELHTDAVTVGQLFLTAAELASLGDREWLRKSGSISGGAPVPMTFTSADDARAYLLERGIIQSGNLIHFQDADAIATNGQLMSILGALYQALT